MMKLKMVYMMYSLHLVLEDFVIYMSSKYVIKDWNPGS